MSQLTKAKVNGIGLDDLKSLKNPALAKSNKQGIRNPFPLDAFPIAIQQIVNELNRTLNFPVDFTAAAILFTLSVAIGNTFHVELKPGYIQNAVIYLALVARRGFNKSHPLSFMLKPLEKKDSDAFNKYKKEKQEVEHILSLSKADREQQGYDDTKKPSPTWYQYLATDFTQEGLIKAHSINLRGIGVYSDELAGFFANFTRYNTGSQEQFWLSAWSGKSIRVNRVNSEPEFLESPFISIVGTIQPEVLVDIAKNKKDNGFMDRILCAIRDDMDKEPLNDKLLDPSVMENWENIIENLLSQSGMPDTEIGKTLPRILKFSPDAKTLFFEHQKHLTDLSNNPANEAMAGIYPKMEMYTIRFALIMELCKYACGEISAPECISIDSVRSAIKLSDYFQKNAEYVNTELLESNPAEKLNKNSRAFYEALDGVCQTKQAIKKGNELGIAERTVKRLLNNKKLFTKLNYGTYEKNYL